jgi:phosphoserine-tRNA(Cys) ligase (EC 6.1.1.-)
MRSPNLQQAGLRILYLIASEEECGVKECKIRVRAVKTPGDINIGVKEHVQRYIMGKKKKIDVRGPVFTTIEMVVME